jgi:hypothetical protein
MRLMQKEPAMLAGGAGAIINAALALAVARGWLAAEEAGLWGALAVALAAALLPLLQGKFTRERVYSPHTIRQAGLSPAQVQRDADDPAVAPMPPATKDAPPVG